MERRSIFVFLFLCVCLFGYSSLGDSRGFSSGGGRSFSSGSSRSFSSGSKSTPAPSSSKSYSSGSKSYSSGSKPSESSSKPSLDSKAAGTYKYANSSSSRPPISEPKVQEQKRQNFYKTYYTDPKYRVEVVHRYQYRDTYNPYFMLWLMDRSINDRAMWAYHHREDMDSERYQELISKDASLEKRIKELEQQGVKKDPNYKPDGVDNDLMYKSDDEMGAPKETTHIEWLTWGLGMLVLVAIWIFVLSKII